MVLTVSEVQPGEGVQVRDGKDVIRSGETVIVIDAGATAEQRAEVVRMVEELTGPNGGACAGSNYVGDPQFQIQFRYLALQNFMRPLRCMQCAESATHMHERPEDYNLRTGLRCATHTADATERGIVMVALPEVIS